MNDGIENLELAAYDLVMLANQYPNGATKAALLEAAAILYRHASEARREARDA